MRNLKLEIRRVGGPTVIQVRCQKDLNWEMALEMGRSEWI